MMMVIKANNLHKVNKKSKSIKKDLKDQMGYILKINSIKAPKTLKKNLKIMMMIKMFIKKDK
jgi:hypothetical protein